jgi:hypothetical protein
LLNAVIADVIVVNLVKFISTVLLKIQIKNVHEQVSFFSENCFTFIGLYNFCWARFMRITGID